MRASAAPSRNAGSGNGTGEPRPRTWAGGFDGTGSASGMCRSTETLRPRRRREARRAVRVDVPEALVVCAESGGEHEAGTKLVHACDLVGEGHAVRDPFREPV